MKKSIFSNLGLKIVAVFVAFGIWLMVVNGSDPITRSSFTGIPVTIENQDRLGTGSVLSVKEGTDTTTIWVEGKRSVIDKLDRTKFKVTADIDNITAMKTIPLKIECSDPRITYKNMWCEPPSLKVDVVAEEERAFIVNVLVQGEPGGKYEVGKADVHSGETVLITGPETAIRIIDKVIANVNVGGIDSDRQLSSIIKIVDKNGNEFTESQLNGLKIKTTKGVLLTDRKLSVDIDLWEIQPNIKLDIQTIGTLAPGYRISGITTTPATINLVGDEQTLRALKGKLTIPNRISVEGEKESFSRQLDLSDFLAERYKKELRQEANSAEKITVNVQIEKIGTRIFNVPISDIDIQEQREDLEITLTPADKIQIEYQPPADNLGLLLSKDVKVVLNLSNPQYSEAGTYEVPLEITLPKGYVLVSKVIIAVNLEVSTKAQKLVTEEES